MRSTKTKKNATNTNLLNVNAIRRIGDAQAIMVSANKNPAIIETVPFFANPRTKEDTRALWTRAYCWNQGKSTDQEGAATMIKEHVRQRLSREYNYQNEKLKNWLRIIYRDPDVAIDKLHAHVLRHDFLKLDAKLRGKPQQNAYIKRYNRTGLIAVLFWVFESNIALK